MSVGSEVETERRNRIRLSLAAYGYEFHNDSFLTDAEFDELAKKINTKIATGHAVLDKFFQEEFGAETGQWIHKHPELDKLSALYWRLKK